MTRRVVCCATRCGMTIARLDGDEIVIRVRHHGEWHVTKIPLRELLPIDERSEASIA